MHQSREWLRPTLAIAVLMALLTAACGDDSTAGGADDDSSGGSGGEVQIDLVTTTPDAEGDVDEITWALPYGEPTTMDPIFGLDYSPSFVSSQMCETLLLRDDEGLLQPNLASFEQVDDITLVLDVRDDVTFWDGQPMTVDDVVYSLTRASETGWVTSTFVNVASIEATGPQEVTISFTDPDARFLGAMASFPGSIVQEEFSTAAGEDLGTPSGGIMCTGPFQFDSWTSGDSLVLVRNDDYWNDEYRARAETLTFKFISDSTALAQALISGEIDGSYEVSPAVVERLQDATNGTLTLGPSRQYTDILVREVDGPMGDPNIRRALAGVVDREGIARVVYKNTAVPRFTMVEPDTWDPQALDLWEDFAAERAEEVPMSVEEAKALVDASDYAGEPISLQILAGDETQNQMAQIVQASASSIGLTIEIMPLQPTAYSDAGLDKEIRAGDIAFSVSWNSGPEPLGVYPWMVRADSPYNYPDYSNPEVEDLLEEAFRTLDPTERNQLTLEVAGIYEPEFLVIPLVEPAQVMFMNNRLTGADPSIEYLFTPAMARVGASSPQ